MQQLSFYVDTMLFVMKQYEEEVDYKLLTEEEREEGKYFKLNEKVLLRTDSKTQMEIMASSINNGIQKPNECRRKLDLMDAEGGDKLIVNGSYIPLEDVGKQYGVDTEGEEQNGEEPPTGEEENQEGQAGQQGADAQDGEPIEPPEEEPEEPPPSDGGESEGQQEEEPEQETAETDGDGGEKEGGEDDEEEDGLHKKKS